MSQSVEDLTVNYEEGGLQVVKELDKCVLTKGAWSTVLFRYQEMNRSTQEYGPDKYVIRRYQKKDGNYLPRSKFVISSPDQARRIIDALNQWLED